MRWLDRITYSMDMSLSTQGFPRAAAPVGVFSRGTTRISGSLSCGARMPPQLEKNHVVPTSSQDEALARDGVSREVPCSALKGETVPDSLPATPKSPPTRRVPSRGRTRSLPLPQPALASAPPAAPRTHLSAPRDLEQRSLCSE